MTAAEIAAALGISERAAKARHARVLKRLRRVLGDDPSQEEKLP
jgi:DNA-directed RNA polymerase specialized sigma24 family protein